MLVMILSRELIHAFQKLQRSSVAFRKRDCNSGLYL